MRLIALAGWVGLVTTTSACSSDAAVAGSEGPPPEAVAGVAVRMDFEAKGEFYASPFPSEARRGADGHPSVAGFPSPAPSKIASTIFEMIAKDTTGFGRTSATFFSLTGAVDSARLPTVAGSVEPGSNVFLVGVDPTAPDHGKRYPLLVDFRADGGPFGAPNLLALLPVQGIPLRARTRYAAVVLRDLDDASGAPLGASLAMRTLIAGRAPAGLAGDALAAHLDALGELAALGVDVDRVAGLAAFTTGDPEDGVAAVRDAMLARPLPAPLAPFARREVFDRYCVYESTLRMPDYQSGAPPFATGGGDWRFDANGAPILAREAEAKVVVTVPRAPKPAGGYPGVVFSRTGAGGDRPLVDRGVQGTHDGPPLVAGSGPAEDFAAVGFAGISVDGPHGGLRNVSHGDEQFLVFNVGNPWALRDNVRQSAAELGLVAHVLASLDFDASDCPGASARASFDASRLALMGHSMGATIAPLTLAVEPTLRAAVLSGAGGSFLENVVFKESPVTIRPVAEVLLGISATGWHLHEHDPFLSMLQWALEPADPPVYASKVVTEPPEGSRPKDVLMMQGIVDTYILPPIANAVSVSLGLDFAGEELDRANAKLATYTPVLDLLPLVGRTKLGFPIAGNVKGASGDATAVLFQQAEDGIENGHEVVFQTEAPKHAYRCFLASFAAGAARVPALGARDEACAP